MDARTRRLVIIVSLAHALAHVYELSLPSVEMDIAKDFGVGKSTMGLLSTTWRLPWGLGALVAGWLVDRFGSRRMLAVYLIGCGVACMFAWLPIPLPALFVVMFVMGSSACIYHPAGLALISYETTAENRPAALGLHGIFGSAGIGLAPFLAAALLAVGLGWRQFYLVLAVPGLILGTMFALLAIRHHQSGQPPSSAAEESDQAQWSSFFLLTTMAVLQGFAYSGVLSFLPRFLSQSPLPLIDVARVSRGGLLTGGVLFVGCLGQYIAGRVARADRLEKQLTIVTLCNVPCLIWMALAVGFQRPAAAALFALVHFMHQPIYNSLIAKYTPTRRRSLCYGFSFAMGLGVGSLGATFAGFASSQGMTYGVLAGTSAAAAAIAGILWTKNHRGAEGKVLPEEF